MPLGNPEAYMQQGMPPEEAMMIAGGAPPMGPPMGAPPMGPDPMMGGAPPMDPTMGGMGQPDPMEMLLTAVMGKWQGQEAQLAGEQQMLLQTLAMIAQSQAPEPQDMFAEGAPTNAGMVPMDDVDSVGPASVPSFPY